MEDDDDDDLLRGGASDNAGPWPRLLALIAVPFEKDAVAAAAAAAAAAAPLGGRDCLNDESGDGPAASGVPP